MKGRIVVVAALLMSLVLGMLFLRGFAQSGSTNPIASVFNGAPRGLKGLSIWLTAEAVPFRIEKDFPLPRFEKTENTLFVVPPPERELWQEDEVRTLLDAVKYRGANLLLLCDEDAGRNGRLKRLLDALDLDCESAEPKALLWAGELPRWKMKILARGTATLNVPAGAVALLASDDKSEFDEEGRTGALWKPHGKGAVFAVASASVFANDALAENDNARFFKEIRAKREVVFLEAHHRSREASFIGDVKKRTGATVALLVIILLPLVVLLGRAPRRGVGVFERVSEPLAAEASVRALASLYARVRSPQRRAPSTSPTSASPTSTKNPSTSRPKDVT